MTRSALAASLWVACAVATGCSRDENLCRIVRAGLDERHDLIQEHAPDEQLRLYLELMETLHPPDDSLAKTVARLGPRAKKPILERLHSEKTDRAKFDLVEVLFEIEVGRTYDVCRDPELQQAVLLASGTMSDPYWRTKVDQDAAMIGWQPGGRSNCPEPEPSALSGGKSSVP